MGDSAYLYARAFASALADGGARIVAIAPGSRNTPLILGFIDEPRLRCFSHLDERCAGYFALGASRGSRQTAVCITTSGTAAANLLPAAVEAMYAGLPLILITADRPHELRDTGAVQAIDQVKLLGASRWFCDVAMPDSSPQGIRYVRHVAAQAWGRANGPPAGPVHLNFPFREPLVSSGSARTQQREFPQAVRHVAGSMSLHPRDAQDIAKELVLEERGVIFVGHSERREPHFASAVSRLSTLVGYPLLAEATSGVRGKVGSPPLIAASEALISDGEFAGEHAVNLVLCFGQAPLSRVVSAWLSKARHVILVSPHMQWPDPLRVATKAIQAEPTSAATNIAECVEKINAQSGPREASSWMTSWSSADGLAREVLARSVEQGPFFEGSIVRAMEGIIPEEALVYAGTSLPIRAMDIFSSNDIRNDVAANRGANGIDGTVSGALGALVATERPVVLFCGDLALLHDIGGLLTAHRYGLPLVIIVADNNGGGIFEGLPQSTIEREVFREYFLTPHDVQLERVAALYGFEYSEAKDMWGLRDCLKAAIKLQGPCMIRAAIDARASLNAMRGALGDVHSALREATTPPPES